MAAKRQARGDKRRVPPKGGRPAAKPDSPSPTQVRIMRAALDLFAERGYAATRTSEIARRAGVAEKTLFANFKSKQALFQKTLDPAALQLLIPHTVPEIAPEGEPGLEELLRAIMENRIGLFRQHPSKFKLILQEMLLNPELAEPFRQKYQEKVAPRMRQRLAELRRAGELRDLPEATIQRVLASSMLGYSVMRFIVHPEADWDDDAEIDAMVSILADGLRPRAS